MNICQLEEKARYLRRKAFDMSINAGKGHLGGSFSCTEILVVLYYSGILRYNSNNPEWEDRDIFILSKGHSVNTFYVLLADLGFFPNSELESYCCNGSMLGEHCDKVVPGIEVVGGSLGHGLGVGCGCSLAAKLDKKQNMTFVIIGDGECQEGSIWEAALFASHHKLNNLIVFLDWNKLGCEDFVDNTSKLRPIVDKWNSFGWETKFIDGHSIEKILLALVNCRERRSKKPLIIIADTIKGKGIPCLENTPQSHHSLPNGEDIFKTKENLK